MSKEIIEKRTICPQCRGYGYIINAFSDQLFEDDCPVCECSGRVKIIQTVEKSDKIDAKIPNK